MGQKGTHVPKFGNWDSNDHVPFTRVFDSARAGKGGRPMNPNDPMENPEAFGSITEDVPVNKKAAANKPPVNLKTSQACHEQEVSTEDRETRRQQEVLVRKQTSESHAQRFQKDANYQNSRAVANSSPSDPPSRRAANAYETPRGSSAPGSGDNSPRATDRPQGRSLNKTGAGSPALERKPSTADRGTTFAPGTPQRSRLRSSSSLVRAEIEKAPALPKFGDWNTNDPLAGQGFTMIFDTARNERKTGGSMQAPPLQAAESAPEPNSSNTHVKPQKPTSKWYCCFRSIEES
ncbi:hypothetical protein O6H91_08G031700 [Diphasiastrum complanatum]|uniref:Uncharacterized protein n=1 Tax=Diphasiastrum complanatum TaxID=34168 RepID=A0ACC2CW32_DIPCM|nr:hypothetical protein O6H91_08G031700 [Diphasiastrum complanatum]